MRKIVLSLLLFAVLGLSPAVAAETVVMETSLGSITLELDTAKAPASVANFLAYADAGFYDGTIFHRVIPNFMIQGGGYTADLKQKPTQPPVKNEAANGLKNQRGTIAMARTRVVDSATSQFFINHKDNAFLDYRGPSPQEIGYAVFGNVIKGMDVVDAIAVTPTRPGDVPVEPIVIESVTLVMPEKVE
jgi:cyclophilin family peptidyl-prolyl cis-trans isomerase